MLWYCETREFKINSIRPGRDFLVAACIRTPATPYITVGIFKMHSDGMSIEQRRLFQFCTQAAA